MEASRVDGVKAPQDAEIAPQRLVVRLLLPEVLLALLLHFHGLGHVPLNPSFHLGAAHLFSMSIFALLLLDERLRGTTRSRNPLKLEKKTTHRLLSWKRVASMA